MPDYFPRRQPVAIRLEEPAAFRRLSVSLVEMAVITGVVLHVYRALVRTHGSDSWLYGLAAITVGVVGLIGMLTAHLANFPLVRWVWRAPLFALIEVAAEMAVAVLLIWAGREPFGSGRAEFADWPKIASLVLLVRTSIVCLWALLLAGVVTIVRRTTGQQDDEAEDEQPVV